MLRHRKESTSQDQSSVSNNRPARFAHGSTQPPCWPSKGTSTPYSIIFAALTAVACSLVLILARSFLLGNEYSLLSHSSMDSSPPDTVAVASGNRCAINFWGLPRAFESLVLPSIIKNVLKPNEQYNCDFFVHYFVVEQEEAGRSGQGGVVHAEQVLLLKQQVLAANPRATVEFAQTTQSEFMEQYNSLLTKIHDTKDPNGKPLYFPWKARTYKFPQTVDNIIKMWHSIQSAWELMKKHETDQPYTHTAMLRSDVVYLYPIDIYEYPQQIVIPGFGRHPVSDRIVYGPRVAVNIWAQERFSRLENHVQYMYTNYPGWGLHSERFVHYALLPDMKQAALANLLSRNTSAAENKNDNDKDVIINESNILVEHPHVCFFRARADETVWVSDCDGSAARASIREELLQGHNGDVKSAVEHVLGRSCPGKKLERLTRTVRTLNCSKSATG